MAAIQPAPMAGPAYVRGCIQVMADGALLSSGGLIVRQIATATDWQIVFYRSLAVAAGLLTILLLRDRGGVLRTFRRAGWPSLIAGASMAVGMATFIITVNMITVANTLFLLASAPFFAAVIAWLLLRERVTVAGIAVMVGHGLVAGSLMGNLIGLLTALSFAAFSVALRAGRAVDMLPAVCLAGIISGAVAASVISIAGTGFAIPADDLGFCFLFGAVIAVALTVYTVGSRVVPAAELTLLSLTEVLLGPLWVWLVVGEVPDVPTVAGGGILLAAIAGLATANIRRRHLSA